MLIPVVILGLLNMLYCWFVITVSLACCPPAEMCLTTACPIWRPGKDVKVLTWERIGSQSVGLRWHVEFTLFFQINKHIKTVCSCFLSLSLFYLSVTSMVLDPVIGKYSQLPDSGMIYRQICIMWEALPQEQIDPKGLGQSTQSRAAARKGAGGKSTSVQCLETPLTGRPAHLCSASSCNSPST